MENLEVINRLIADLEALRFKYKDADPIVQLAIKNALNYAELLQARTEEEIRKNNGGEA